MTTYQALTLLIAIESGLIVFAATQDSAPRMAGLGVAVNMVFIALFGPQLMVIGNHVTNVTNICYAAAICTQCIILQRYGERHAIRAAAGACMALSATFVLSFAMRQFPPTGIDGRFSDAVQVVLYHSPAVVIAGYIALLFAMATLIWTWRLCEGMPAIPRMIVASWTAQVVDTPIFFSVAFGHVWTVDQIIDAVIAGFVVKCAAALVFAPVFMVAVAAPWRHIRFNQSRT